jgi:uncharacterized protein (TIGR02145 family)
MGYGKDHDRKRGDPDKDIDFQMMKSEKHIWVFVGIFVLVLLFSACHKEGSESLPDMTLRANPVKGLTTDVFEIKADPVDAIPSGLTLFYRWDLDNDGVWDTRFSTSNQLKYRFMKPGTRIVRVEYSDGKRQVAVADLSLPVEQGFSAPHPNFEVSPDSGNYLTNFSFDASLTRDDEDSLGTLKFRWDFVGDGKFNTSYSHNPVASWKYESSGLYHPKLEVVDPSGKAATFSAELKVNRIDTLIVPLFTINDSLIRVGDTLRLDASSSYRTGDSKVEFYYSWFLPNRVEWTDPSVDPMITSIVGQSGPFSIGLRITDRKTNLFNSVSRNFYAATQNMPPIARFETSSTFGNIRTQFLFDCWTSSDDNLAPSEIEVRWDFDGDGAWDTPWTRDKTIFHQYTIAGDYSVGLIVRDDLKQTALFSKTIHVSPWTNETGFMRDPRDAQYYGTVHLGNQWWMAENLNFAIPQKLREGVLQWLCLFEQGNWCDQVGKLYRVGAVIENRTDPEFVEVCPPGWKIPSKEDWEALFQSIGGLDNAKELRTGGKADFNALDMGYGTYRFLEVNGVIVDTIYEFHETFQRAWFLSTSTPYDPQHLRTDTWQFGIGKDLVPWVGYDSPQHYLQVRCMKEN